MKRTVILLTSLWGVAQAAPPVHYISSVQMVVQEPNAQLTRRAQRLVMDQFASSVEFSPILQSRHYEARMNGNEVVFMMTSDSDLREPVQEALSSMVQGLNGRVLARGKSMFYRAALTQPMGGYLEVVMDDSHKKILAISAQSVPLRDILNEIRTQAGSVSFLIPGDCAEKPVDWSFGDAAPTEPKDIDLVMNELATLFSLKCEKKNGTYIFTGQCPNVPMIHHRSPGNRDNLQDAFFNASSQPMGTQVVFPVIPLNQ